MVDYDSLPRVVDEVKAVVGNAGLNLLVNNAGIAGNPTKHGGLLEDLELQQFRNVLETNTIAPLMLIKVCSSVDNIRS